MELGPHIHPIIYVRGYAMTRGEIDETTADPFCGFNLGATVFRATAEKKRANKFVFESPVLRLGTDFGYRDVFEDGEDILDSGWKGQLDRAAIVVYRYYDSASNLLGDGETPEMEEFARGLSRLVARVRTLVCAGDPLLTEDSFRCYLVAHSMGGLVCRAFLQNEKWDVAKTRGCVDKLFTYATPHNGIEMVGINVPKWLSLNDMSNFNRTRMAGYLGLKEQLKKSGRVDYLPESALPSERVFCLVGTNRSDYEVAAGLSRTFAGNGSDGLVRIENATLHGLKANGQTTPCAKAFVYRAHSGPFGIVNSEEAYQNLTRFLFGDVRVDLWIDVDALTLPEELAGKDVDALYQFEILASPRGKRWYLTRRTAEEDSVACLTHEQWRTRGTKKISLYASSLFLAKRARVNPEQPSLAYSMTLGVRVPDYEVGRTLWFDKHYEGRYLFRDSVVIELVPPEHGDGEWSISSDWLGDEPGVATQPVQSKALKSGKVEVVIPFESHGGNPGIRGKLRFVVSTWNDWHGA